MEGRPEAQNPAPGCQNPWENARAAKPYRVSIVPGGRMNPFLVFKPAKASGFGKPAKPPRARRDGFCVGKIIFRSENRLAAVSAPEIHRISAETVEGGR